MDLIERHTPQGGALERTSTLCDYNLPDRRSMVPLGPLRPATCANPNSPYTLGLEKGNHHDNSH